MDECNQYLPLKIFLFTKNYLFQVGLNCIFKYGIKMSMGVISFVVMDFVIFRLLMDITNSSALHGNLYLHFVTEFMNTSLEEVYNSKTLVVFTMAQIDINLEQ